VVLDPSLKKDGSLEADSLGLEDPEEDTEAGGGGGGG